MGLVHWWARAAALAPRLANAMARGRWTGAALKALAGIARERRLPAFAERTFRSAFHDGGGGEPPGGVERRRNQVAAADRTDVILWPDTFNDHFHPEVLRAGLEVLRSLGCRVRLPQSTLCCGRPLYDWGMLGLARPQLRRILRALEPEIRLGTPIVGLEPSCVAVFRDELHSLFPQDQNALRLASQVTTLGEFLAKRGLQGIPRLGGRALVQGHCHHKAIMGMDGEHALYQSLGLEFQVLDSGCCGMAGSFGFEAGETYEVSRRCGERVLLPAVRRADPETLIVADGFSCREQIEQGTGRQVLHTAEVVRRALRGGPAPRERTRLPEIEQARADDR
jgi:Fe-S oxidoreductase